MSAGPSIYSTRLEWTVTEASEAEDLPSSPTAFVYKVAFMASYSTKMPSPVLGIRDGTNSAICHYMSQELTKPLTSDQVRAARALLRWSAARTLAAIIG